MATQIVNGLVTNADEFTWTQAPVNWTGYTSWDGFGNTLVSGGSISTTLTFLSDAVDLGSLKNIVMTASATTNSSTAHVISFETSPDDTTYTAASAGTALSARYVKTKIVVTNTSARPGFTNLSSSVVEDVISESLFNVAVTHSSDEFQLTETKSYSKILSITGTQNSAVSGSYAVIPTDYTATAPKVKVVNLDTFGKVTADVNIDVIISGLPGVTVLSSGDVELS
jgi:hypothetical protein